MMSEGLIVVWLRIQDVDCRATKWSYHTPKGVWLSIIMQTLAGNGDRLKKK